jgi:hypothetical protein
MRMSHTRLAAAALAAALTAGCGLLPGKDKSSSSTPTSPSPTPAVNMDAFAGVWTSATASTPATGCGNLKYTVTPVSASTANVTFNATCGGAINVGGTGTGTLSGSALNWSAQGLVSQGGVNCPFTFTNGKATSDTASQIVVTYGGTVCGIPVSGTEIVKK